MFNKFPIQLWVIYMTFNKCVFNIVIKTFLGVPFEIIYFFRNLLKDFQSARLPDLRAFFLARSRLRVCDLIVLSYQGLSFGLIMTSLFGTLCLMKCISVEVNFAQAVSISSSVRKSLFLVLIRSFYLS